jgi:cytochrome c553
MKIGRGIAVVLAASIVALWLDHAMAAPIDGLAWAYPQGKTSAWNPKPVSGLIHLPGSTRAFTFAQLADDHEPPDWFPQNHPPPPMVVAHDRTRRTTPCASCHFYNGRGFPGSADLAGLPASYIVAQVKAFRSGNRRSAQADRDDTLQMIEVARAVSDADAAQAARYFASLPRHRIARVVETATVPRTFPDKYGWLNLAPGKGREPIGNRVIEVSDDLPRMFMSDDRVGMTAYVPPGAIARGAAIVKTGGRAGQPCAACHGARLSGTATVPPISGDRRRIWRARCGISAQARGMAGR